MNWRLLEAEIVRIARSRGFDVDENGKSGDKIMVLGCNDDPNAHQINLTEFAQELARTLGMKA